MIMPYFRIIYKIEKQQAVKLIRLNVTDVDYCWKFYYDKLKEKYGTGRIEFFDCVMVSKYYFEGDPREESTTDVPDVIFGLTEATKDFDASKINWKKTKRKPPG